MSKKMRANLLLLLTAFIWGTAFVAQIKGMDNLGPFSYAAARNFVGGLFLIPVALYFRAKDKTQRTKEEAAYEKKHLILGGIFCGLALFVAGSLQQVGLAYTTAGKAGFITALYIVIVPILGIFIGKKVRPIIWGCVAVAALGLYLLSITSGFSISKGDFLILLCALGFSIHILVIDYFSPKTDGVSMSCIQFFVVSVCSAVVMLIFEEPSWVNIVEAWMPIIYAGVLSSGVGYTLQIVAQRDTDPTTASLLMSLESVFALIAGMVALHEVMSGRQILGCVLMFGALIVAQLPEKKTQLKA